MTDSGTDPDVRSLSILHLSDLRKAPEDAVRRLLERLDVAPDLVVVTGNLSENGRPSELREALRALDLLAEAFRLGHNRFVLLPGDRDVNRDACAAYFSECRAEEREPEPPYAPKWRSFALAFRDFYGDSGNASGAGFSEARPWTLFEIPELGVAVAALDSTLAASHLPEGSEAPGLLGEEQLRWFATALEPARRKGWLRLAALHHAPEGLRDSGAFTEHLAEHIHLVLHGATPAGQLTARLLRLEPGRLRIVTDGADGTETEEPFDAARAPAAFFGPGEDGEEEAPPPRNEPGGPSDPGGPAGDDFLSRVEAACRLRERPGAEIRRLREGNPPVDYLRIAVPEGGMVSIFPVGALEHGATRDGLESFLTRVDARYREGDSGLVSRLVYGGDQPAPPELAREAADRRVHLQSFIELQGLLDFRTYVERQTRRLAENPHYPPAHYVPARLRSSSSCGMARDEETEDAAGRLLDWLASPHGRFVLVLGDSGTGKTFLLHEVARRLGERGGLIPVLLEMRHLEKGRTLDQLLGQHFAPEGIEELSIPRFRYMLEQGRIALLFDGFDELAARVTYPRAVEHFETLLQAASGAAKVVVTGRRQHFASDRQIRTVLGEEVDRLAGRRVAVLEPFDPGRVRELLRRQAEGDEARAAERLGLLESTAGLLGLSSNPRMLGFIAELSEEWLRRARSPQGEITAATLYRVLIERWLEAEIDRARPEGAGDLPLLTLGERLEALSRIALRLWRTGEPSLDMEELTDEVGRAIATLRRGPIDPSAAVFQVGSGTLLVRDADGAFSFLHPSLLEWLVAWRASGELTPGREPLALAGREMSPLMADFFVSLAGRDLAVAWARATLRGEAGDGAKASALQVLRHLGEETHEPMALAGRDLRGQDLAGRDLAGADLTGADLSAALLAGATLTGARLAGARLDGADLTGARLRGADLTGADLTGARLLDADLEGARCEGARMRRAKLLGSRRNGARLDGCDLFGAALEIPATVEAATAAALPCAALAWSPRVEGISEPDLLATAEGRLVRIWEASTLRELRRLAGHDAPVRGVAWSPDGRLLASASEDRTIRLWEVETGREVERFWGHKSWVTSVAFQPRGSLLASGSYDRTTRLWDLESGKEVRRFPGHWVLALAFHPDGRYLATGGGDRIVHLWDIVVGQERRRFEGHTDYVRGLAFGLRGTTLASASEDHTVRVWDPATGRELHRLEHQDQVLAVAFDSQGEVLASASEDRTVRLWNAVTGREERRFLGHTRGVPAVAVQPGGELVASGSLDSTVRLWSAASGQETRRSAQPDQAVAGLAFGPAPLLYAALHDRTVRLWDVQAGRELHVLQGPADRLWSVAVAPRGNTLAAAAADGALHLWDLATREPRKIADPGGGVFCVAFSPDGTILASGAADRTVSLWDPATSRLRRRLSGFTGGVRSVAFSPDGTLLAAAAPDPVLRLWDPRTGMSVGELRGHESNLFAVAWSPDGTTLAAGSSDKTVRLWDVASREESYRLKGHQDTVWSVAFSPDGRLLASGSLDGTVRLWDMRLGIEAVRLNGHLHRVLAVAFSPDGTLLASGSSDNTIRLWDVASGEHRATLGLLPEGWVAWTPEGRYRLGGLAAGGFWHTIGLCRFEAGELEELAEG